MDANTCGMETYQAGVVNMEEYPALYMPTPADETIQICVKGCPGGRTTGTCRQRHDGLSRRTRRRAAAGADLVARRSARSARWRRQAVWPGA